MPAQARSIHDSDRMLEIERTRLSQYPIQESQQVVVGIGAAAEQDDSRSSCSLDREKSRIIEIRGRDNLPLRSCECQDFGVPRACQPDARCVNRLMPGGNQPVYGLRRNRHVDKKLQPPTSSTLSSSARLAA